MANPYFVQPGNNHFQGLMALSEGINQYGQQKRQDEETARVKQRFTDAQKAMSEAYQSKDPNKIMQVAIDYPEVQKTAELMFGVTNENSKNAAIQTYRRILTTDNPEEQIAALDNGIEEVANFEGKPYNMIYDRIGLQNPETRAQTLQNIKMVYSNIDPEGWKRMFPNEAGKNNKAFQDFDAKAKAAGLTPGTPEYQGAARISLGIDPRAGTITGDERIAGDAGLTASVAQSQAQIAGAESGAREGAKLVAQAKLKPEVEKAVTLAKEQAKQVAEQAGEKRSNSTALRMYDTAMQSLSDALADTATGPGVGFLPALTTNAQIAEGAVASMAPILKQMFRTAGEGTFTDKDQEMLLKMIPTRSTHPEAREAQIKAIDAIVRAKLNQPEEAAAGEGTIGRFKVRAK